ncbi:guanylate cyclase soluble subunit beta-2-like [Babylonia areolata]|uniref:guanylate cyclase soluble subunit beta-2-like n=1 Tax=Babylonia areolata TaxID=304850 RepID=UPI003FD2AF50
MPLDTLLKLFGKHFLIYCMRHGYDKMLRTLGSNIYTFIQNLDSLHALLAITYRGMVAPSFRCDVDENGDMLLHYYSVREGFHPIVIGILEAAGKEIFQQVVKLTVIRLSEEHTQESVTLQHTVFKVKLEQGSSATGSTTDLCALTQGPSGAIDPDQHSVIKVSDICRALPYHFVLNEDMCIQQCGENIRRVTKIEITTGLPFKHVGEVVKPYIQHTLADIRKFINGVFIVAIYRVPNDKSQTFLVKGQMIWMEHSRVMMFIGTPRLSSLDEMMDMKIFLADIPIYDATRELVLLNQQRIAEIDVAKALDKTTAELKKTSIALEIEKKKTEDLLHMMLPKKVAISLTHGIPVKAEKFENTTILFSDIVTFTNIASACSPMDVVNMLNSLYNHFDSYVSRHGIYKVETIGDAYMGAAGVPEVDEKHAERIADFALDIMEEAAKVNSPATGLPLQIRVGIHTGPVVAGVVGKKMPRYCLFGDTVNTASRMESHGLPGRIHLSQGVHDCLYKYGYVTKRRGEMMVKGKGKMTTFFLMGKLDYRGNEPDDSFAVLPEEVCPEPIIRTTDPLLQIVSRVPRKSFNFLKMSMSSSSLADVAVLPTVTARDGNPDGTDVDMFEDQQKSRDHKDTTCSGKSCSLM